MDEHYYPVGTRVVVTRTYDTALEGMVGTVCVTDSNNILGIEFDNKFCGGHTLRGHSKNGHGYWVPPEFIAPLDSDETPISLDEEVRFY